MNMEPYELAENVADGREAVYICAEILRRQWSLSQTEYAQILDKIPEDAIKQYLRKKSREKKAHRERLSDLLKEQKSKQTEAMTLREKILQEVKELKAEPLMQRAPTAIELVEDNYPEVVDYLSTEGMIAGLLIVLELLDEEDNNNTK